MTRYAERRELGLCANCPAQSGKLVRCPTCAARHNAVTATDYAEDPEYQHVRRRDYRGKTQGTADALRIAAKRKAALGARIALLRVLARFDEIETGDLYDAAGRTDADRDRYHQSLYRLLAAGHATRHPRWTHLVSITTAGRIELKSHGRHRSGCNESTAATAAEGRGRAA